jgi:hypothetical protein
MQAVNASNSAKDFIPNPLKVADETSNISAIRYRLTEQMRTFRAQEAENPITGS